MDEERGPPPYEPVEFAGSDLSSQKDNFLQALGMGKPSDQQRSLTPTLSSTSDWPTAHSLTHGKEFPSMAKLYRQAVHLALRLGASTPAQIKGLLPDLPCSFLKTKADRYKNSWLVYRRPDCAACCQEDILRGLVAEKPVKHLLHDTVAYLREETREVILREDCSWELLKDDLELVALYSKNAKKQRSFAMRGLRGVYRAGGWVLLGVAIRTHAGRRYIEDLDFGDGKYVLLPGGEVEKL